MTNSFEKKNTNDGVCWFSHIDGLVQERRNSSALAMDLCLSCTNPPICPREISSTIGMNDAWFQSVLEINSGHSYYSLTMLPTDGLELLCVKPSARTGMFGVNMFARHAHMNGPLSSIVYTNRDQQLIKLNMWFSNKIKHLSWSNVNFLSFVMKNPLVLWQRSSYQIHEPRYSAKFRDISPLCYRLISENVFLFINKTKTLQKKNV